MSKPLPPAAARERAPVGEEIAAYITMVPGSRAPRRAVERVLADLGVQRDPGVNDSVNGLVRDATLREARPSRTTGDDRADCRRRVSTVAVAADDHPVAPASAGLAPPGSPAKEAPNDHASQAEHRAPPNGGVPTGGGSPARGNTAAKADTRRRVGGGARVRPLDQGGGSQSQTITLPLPTSNRSTP